MKKGNYSLVILFVVLCCALLSCTGCSTRVYKSPQWVIEQLESEVILKNINWDVFSNVPFAIMGVVKSIRPPDAKWEIDSIDEGSRNIIYVRSRYDKTEFFVFIGDSEIDPNKVGEGTEITVRGNISNISASKTHTSDTSGYIDRVDIYLTNAEVK